MEISAAQWAHVAWEGLSYTLRKCLIMVWKVCRRLVLATTIVCCDNLYIHCVRKNGTNGVSRITLTNTNM